MNIDLNCDLGESFGTYTLGRDAEIIPLITTASIACGYHAGDAQTMAKSVRLCKEAGTLIGAHPGLPDLVGFGRRTMAISPEEARNDVLYQVGALAAIAKAEGLTLHHVKLHGALYNMAAKDYSLSKAIFEGLKAYDASLTILVLAGSEMQRAAEDLEMKVACEVFADRAYMPDGSLVPRRQKGSMITDEDEAVRRVIRMVREGKVTAIDGSDVPLKADSVCVHGDGEKALLFTRRLKEALESEGITLRPFA